MIEFQFKKPLKDKQTGEYLKKNQFGNLQATYGVKVKGEDYYWSVSEYLFRKLDGLNLEKNTFEITKAEGEGGKTNWIIKDALGNDLPQTATQPLPTPEKPATSDSGASQELSRRLDTLGDNVKEAFQKRDDLIAKLEERVNKLECERDGEPYVPRIEEKPSEQGVSIDQIPF